MIDLHVRLRLKRESSVYREVKYKNSTHESELALFLRGNDEQKFNERPWSFIKHISIFIDVTPWLPELLTIIKFLNVRSFEEEYIYMFQFWKWVLMVFQDGPSSYLGAQDSADRFRYCPGPSWISTFRTGSWSEQIRSTNTIHKIPVP